MTPRERYDAAVEATRLLRAVFNNIGDASSASEALRIELYVASQAAERIAGKLYGPAFYAPVEDEAP